MIFHSLDKNLSLPRKKNIRIICWKRGKICCRYGNFCNNEGNTFKNMIEKTTYIFIHYHISHNKLFIFIYTWTKHLNSGTAVVIILLFQLVNFTSILFKNSYKMMCEIIICTLTGFAIFLYKSICKTYYIVNDK